MAFPFRFGPGSCCCPSGCWSFADNFDVPASTDLGSEWNEVTGNWEPIGDAIAGWLHELAGTTPGTDGTANAKVMGTQPVPARSAGEMIVNVSIVDPVIDDVFYIFLACTDANGAGGDWVRFTYASLHTWLVTLSTGASKTQTYSPPEPLSTTTPVVGCIDSDGFMYGAIAASGDEYPWGDGAATGDGRYAGLGHNNDTHGAVFDSFQIRELRANVDCVSCFCHCGTLNDRNNIKSTLALTIFDATDRASCMGAMSVGMTWEWNSGNARWVSDVMRIYSQTEGSSAYSDFKWFFECGTHDPNNPFAHFSLTWYPGYKTCCSGNSGGCDGVYLPIAGSSTCTPLSLVFGPFSLSRGEATCNACWDFNDPSIGPPNEDPPPPYTGEYYIAITEA